MHELSMAYSLVETAVAAARANNISQVDSVHLRLGQLAGVVKEALLFAYEIATENTLLAGSSLEIEELPIVVLCPQCQSEQTLVQAQYLCCPICGTPTAQIIQGKEIEIVSLTYHDEL
jgi:hydrogenase nickel incorporation protein HypA/HybF